MTDKDLDSTSGTRMEERHAHGKSPRMYTTQVAPLHDKRNTYCDLHIHQQSHMNHKQNQIHSPYLTDYASPTKYFKRPCGAVSLITVSLITVPNHQPSLEPVNFTLEGVYIFWIIPMPRFFGKQPNRQSELPAILKSLKDWMRMAERRCLAKSLRLCATAHKICLSIWLSCLMRLHLIYLNIPNY